jgi:PPOX class probable FMN-dependent enzyme
MQLGPPSGKGPLKMNETPDDPHRITSLSSLERLYGQAAPNSLRKEIGHLHPVYRALVEASPFVVLATSGPSGLDASPRGDAPGFVAVQDEHTLLLPDRRGNNRLDSLRNILVDPRVALLFMVPGVGETLRVNGHAHISTAPDLLQRFRVQDKAPTSVLVVHIVTVYFQCSKSLIRSRLWDAATHVDRAQLPSAGTILSTLTQAEVDAKAYDQALPERLKSSLY